MFYYYLPPYIIVMAFGGVLGFIVCILIYIATVRNANTKKD